MAAFGGTGFSIVEAAKGAEASATIAEQPSRTEAAIAGYEADKSKAVYEKDRYGALQDYMKGAKSGEAGKAAYGLIKDGTELQQRQQALKQKEAEIAKLAPEDQTHAQVSLDREQKMIDTLQSKVTADYSKHLGVINGALSGIKDEKSFTGAASFIREEAAAAADEAVKEGKISPENKEAFVRDQLKGAGFHLDERGNPIYDEQSKSGTSAHLKESMSQKELTDAKLAEIKEQHEHTYQMSIAETAKKNARALEKTAANEDRKTKQDRIKTIHEIFTQQKEGVKEADTEIKDMRAHMDKVQKEAPTVKEEVPGHFYGTNSKNVPNPELKQLQEAIAQRETDVKKSKDALKETETALQAEAIREGVKLPSHTSKKKTTEVKPAGVPQAEWELYLKETGQ